MLFVNFYRSLFLLLLLTNHRFSICSLTFCWNCSSAELFFLQKYIQLHILLQPIKILSFLLDWIILYGSFYYLIDVIFQEIHFFVLYFGHFAHFFIYHYTSWSYFDQGKNRLAIRPYYIFTLAIDIVARQPSYQVHSLLGYFILLHSKDTGYNRKPCIASRFHHSNIPHHRHIIKESKIVPQSMFENLQLLCR